MPNRNSISLIFSGLIAAGFFVSGLLDILDYMIVKALLFSSSIFLAVYLLRIVFKDIDPYKSK